ncbi:hypothetical protein PPERSA_11140 [Pseudocohnilembus persalinus]|uniref:P-loop containing nucleoside triphosphate hydrolase n=1 Tax=Pseudocohnilembus persalinus TaxID=266149 RepID=A0A0V0QZ61_PSEPJ|nr:hypothetical protein PPERSA_11140 [Pseudocohnilembus persalinus]|eukprot:KRX07591.1 hypothetical protein PPERSA_11140 [Pseudocohnilembus persalinus]
MAYKNGDKVVVYKSEKANGENAQISYIKELDSFVVCSKNVSMIVRNEKDIEFYKNQEKKRYDFAVLIAETWFRLLNERVEKLGKLQQLKEYMNGKTFVAEYCGNQEFQHLVKYNEIDLLFYAIVQNDQQLDCVPLEISTKIFQNFGLTICKFEKFFCDSEQEFNQTVLNLYDRVSRSSVEEEGEGASQLTPLSLCKLKTLEYRIFRKLREKLKNAFNKKDDLTRIYNKFENETKELCQYFPANKNLSYYFEIGKTAFNYIANTNNEIEKNIIAKRYIYFLDMMIKAIKDKAKIDRNFITKQLQQAPLTKEEKEELENQNVKAYRIVVISPAFYLKNEDLKQIQEEFAVKNFITSWHAKSKMMENREIVLLNMFMKDLKEADAAGLRIDTYFLFLGYDLNRVQEQVDLIEKEVDNVALQTGQKKAKGKKGKVKNSLQNDSNRDPYLNANDKVKFFQDQIRQAQSVYQSMQKFMPKNCEWVDDLYKEQNPLQVLKDKIREGITQIQVQEIDLNLQQGKGKQKVLKQNLTVFVPLTIPASGKTTFLKALMADITDDISFRSISSDQQRKELMEEVSKQNKGKLSGDELFDKTGKKASEIWKAELGNLVKKTNQTGKENNILFLDKNHPLNAVKSSVGVIKQNLPSNVNCTIVGITPKCTEIYDTGSFNYPFSLQYFITCLNRAIYREDHETLVGSPYKMGSVLIMFLNLFKGCQFNEMTMRKNEIDEFIQLPFTADDEDFEEKFPQHLKKLLKNALIFVNDYRNNLQECPQVIEFIDKYLEAKIEIKEIDRNIQIEKFKQKLKEFLKEEFKNESTGNIDKEEEEEKKQE